MAIPESYQAFRRTEGTAPLTIEQVTEQLPPIQSHDVLVRIHAVSLNYRDIAMLDGTYPQPCLPRGIPASDCAAEVVSVGPEVNGFKPGDRVTTIWDLTNLTGLEEGSPEALGGDVDGVLRQYAVFKDQVLVHLPEHLSWEEASCITCAGTTAWNALDFPRASGTALLQGTGGVSMFALLLCLAAGVQPIITSSSDEKLNQARSLGPAVKTINYKKTAKWEDQVLRLTNGRGADVAIENVGPATVKQSIDSLAQRGTLSLVGFLGGLDAEKFPDLYFPVLVKRLTMRGIIVGSKIDQQALCDFLAEKKVSLKPLIDAVFPFEKSEEAFAHLKSGKHQGKIVITL
ncbi:zinc-dependent alcohol dehydrogenase family protein [Aspergillus homomorphus CBS 101889]|uniref:Alcohol dehydrogenase n=1 Tax=Aspergillus homomorphus (strain CBS 101889) TaxID=1450537 RepID=A0A395HMB0_ASPHC|nr:alcohol dehydrogenase [Aspergillus homomorphus CBS 101889]RAL07998.1 alcohol dehydrogenase [Aspergillus homomorphus CBS 101889]